jgi:membrane protein implicated in regulation of membrane protease activity
MSLTDLARLRLAGRLCRLGSWFILAVGLIASICLFFAIYNSFMADPGPSTTAPIPLQALQVSFALSGIIVIFTSFFFILLFAVGAWLEYTSTKQDSQEKQSSQNTDRETNYEHVEITSLPR